jgi:hypothetical protein
MVYYSACQAGHPGSSDGKLLVVFEEAHLSCPIRTLVEGAVTGKQLAPASRTLLNIATRHMKFALNNPAIVARVLVGVPVVVLVAVTNAKNGFPINLYDRTF